MKTTIELPDALFMAAKSVAAKRRTTLKAMMEHALRREIGDTPNVTKSAAYELNEYAFPVLKKQAGPQVTNEDVYALLDEE